MLYFLSVVSADLDLRSSFLRGLGLRKEEEVGMGDRKLYKCTKLYNLRPTVYNTPLHSHFSS